MLNWFGRGITFEIDVFKKKIIHGSWFIPGNEFPLLAEEGCTDPIPAVIP